MITLYQLKNIRRRVFQLIGEVGGVEMIGRKKIYRRPSADPGDVYNRDTLPTF